MPRCPLCPQKFPHSHPLQVSPGGVTLPPGSNMPLLSSDRVDEDERREAIVDEAAKESAHEAPTPADDGA